MELDDFETMFVELGALLRGVAVRRYGIPAEVADEMVHECFTSYLQRQDHVHNARGWLYATLRHRCTDWLRDNGREAPPQSERDYRDLVVAAVLVGLSDKDRRTLRAFYLGDNRSELAAELAAPGHVDQLVSTVRRRAMEMFRSLGPAIR